MTTRERTGEAASVLAADNVNEVYLRGRLAAAAELRELPSGDVLLAWRLTVARPAEARGSVDSIDCSSTRPRVIRTIQAAVPEDRLEITGSLRRRFWRGPSGPQSRYAVEVTSARRLTPGRRGGA